MRILIPNCIATVITSKTEGRGAYGEPIQEVTEVEVEGLLTGRTESKNPGELDPRFSSYDYNLSVTGFQAEKVESAGADDKVIIGGKTYTIKEASHSYRSISVRRSRVQVVITLHMERAG